jgi:hypothetical protein
LLVEVVEQPTENVDFIMPETCEVSEVSGEIHEKTLVGGRRRY